MSRRIVVISHIHPDGDAVASVLSMQHALEQLGKEVYPVLHDGAPDIFSFMPTGKAPIQQDIPTDADLCIVLDLNDAARTGYTDVVKEYGKMGKLVTVDHHLRGDLARLSADMVHQESAAATTEIVYRLVSQMGLRITPDLATCLLTGIYTDTGGFQYPNTTTETLEIAAELMRRGAKLNLIARTISHSKTVSSLKLLGIALQRLRLTHDNRCAVSVITQEDIIACGAGKEDVGGIIGELNVLPQIRCTLLLTEIEPGLISGSLRSGEAYKTPVSLLAKAMGGGGHPRAAGFSLAGHINIDEQSGTWKIAD